MDLIIFFPIFEPPIIDIPATNCNTSSENELGSSGFWRDGDHGKVVLPLPAFWRIVRLLRVFLLSFCIARL